MSRYNKGNKNSPNNNQKSSNHELYEPDIDYDFYLATLGEQSEKAEQIPPIKNDEETQAIYTNEMAKNEDYINGDYYDDDYEDYEDDDEYDDDDDYDNDDEDISPTHNVTPKKSTKTTPKKTTSKKSKKKNKKPFPLSIIIISALLLIIILSLSFFVYMKLSGKLNLSSEPDITSGSSAHFVATMPTATPVPTPSPTPEPTVVPVDTSKTNLLTGELTLTDEAVGKRPVAVMVSNVSTCLPQYGLSYADLIFEIPVEGNITRLMAMFGDYTKVPNLCPIRSCRYYYPMLSEGFDAIYVHWGMEQKYAYNTLKELEVDNLNGSYDTYGLFGRNQDRINQGLNLEHTSEFYGTELATALIENNHRIDLMETQKAPYFNFTDDEYSAGATTTNFTIDFGSYYTEFNYNAEDKLFYKKHNGNDHIDGLNSEQLSFKNILILETPVNIMPNYGAGVKQIDVTGDNKSGYYISNGKVQRITWSKDSADGRIILYTEKGLDLYLNTGKTYVAISNPNSCESFN